METQLKVGDTVWIYVPYHKGNKTKCKIVHIFDYCGTQQYVVEYYNSIDYSLEVRDWLTIALSEDSNLNMWKIFKKK